PKAGCRALLSLDLCHFFTKSTHSATKISASSPSVRPEPPCSGANVSTLSYSAILTERSMVGREPPDLKGVQAKFEVRGLSFWYGSSQALYDISVVVPECSAVALIGPSGCGKSTFLRTLNRMNDLIPGTRHTGEI